MYTFYKYALGILINKSVCIFLFCLFLYQISSYPKTSPENRSKLENEKEYSEVIEENIPLLKLPELIYSTDIHYPIDISRQGIEGSVLLDMIIDESGKVENVSIVRGIHPTLDTCALKASKKFIFSPAIDKDSNKIPVLIQYEINYDLKDVIYKIDEFINLTGRLLERGTRKPVKDTKVILKPIKFFPDTTLPVPAHVYFRRIGKISDQYLENNQIITTTDSKGVFSFYNIPSCSLQISIISFDYDLFKALTVVNLHKKKIHNIYLRKKIYSDYEIQVYGKEDKKGISHNTLHVNEIQKVPGLAGNAIKVVQTLPGVARPMFSSGELIIRGSANSDNKYFMDGVRIPKLYHAYGLLSTYNSEFLHSIDFYPGCFNSRFGGAISGIIEVNSRSPKTDRFHYKSDFSSLDASILAEGPINKKLSFATSGRISYIGPVMEKFTQESDMTVVPDYWDIISRIEYNNKKVKTYLQYFSSNDRMTIINSGRNNNHYQSNITNYHDNITFHTLSYGFDNTFNNRVKNEFRTSIQRYDRSRNGFNSHNNYSENFKVDLGSFRDECQLSFTKNFALNTGLDFELFTIENSLSSAHKYYSLSGIYTNLEFSLFNHLFITPGIRYDYYYEFKEGTPSYRIMSRYNPIKNHTIKAAAGTYNKSPDPIGDVLSITNINSKIPLTLSTQYSAGYEWFITDLLSLDIQGYYTEQENIPREISPGEKNTRNDNEIQYSTDMKGRMYGLEVLLRHQLGKNFFGWISYTFSRSERKSPNPPAYLYIPDKPWNSEKWFLFEKDQTHNVQLIGSWKLPGNWQPGFRFRYVTGNPYTPISTVTKTQLKSDSEFGLHIEGDGELDIYDSPETQYHEYGDINSERMDPFIQLDLRIDKKTVFKNWILSMYIDIQNVNYFWYNSPEYSYYTGDSKFKDTISGMILPKLGLSVEF